MDPFLWDPSTGRYRWPNGRFVSRAEVREAIDRVLQEERVAAQAVLKMLRDGDISLSGWRTEMRGLIKNVHLFSAALARGGWAQLEPTDYTTVTEVVFHEYRFLERLARGIANKTIPLDGRVTDRVRQYMEAGRDTYHIVEREVMRDAGYTYESNHLHPAEHCTGCLDETARGRVPIGDLIPIGRRKCGRKCKCTLDYWKNLITLEG